VIKKKKHRISSVQIICLGLGLALIIIFSLYLYKKSNLILQETLSPYFKIKNITYDIQSFYSNTQKQELLNVIHKKIDQKSIATFDQKSFIKELQTQFPIISMIKTQYKIPHTLHFSISGTRPCYTINNQCIVIATGALFNISDFKDFTERKLNNITIYQKKYIQNNKLLRQVKSFFDAIPQERFDQFDINYIKPSCIELQPKDISKKITIIADEKSFFDQIKFTAIDKILNDLSTKNLLISQNLKAEDKKIKFDLRFKNRIIVKFFDEQKRGDVQ
jgi:hypothetical protein